MPEELSKLAPPPAPGAGNVAQRTALSFAHLDEASSKWHDRKMLTGSFKGNLDVFHTPGNEETLMTKYAGLPGDENYEHNRATIRSWFDQKRRASFDASETQLRTLPELQYTSQVDEGTGIRYSTVGGNMITAIQKASQIGRQRIRRELFTRNGVYKGMYADDADDDTWNGWLWNHALPDWAKTGIVGIGQAANESFFGAFRKLNRHIFTWTGKFDSPEEFDQWYEDLTFDTPDALGKGMTLNRIAHMVGSMVPFIVSSYFLGAGGAGAKAAESGKAVGVLGKVLRFKPQWATPNFIHNYARAGGRAAQLVETAADVATSAFLTAGIEGQVNPETGKWEDGYFDPETGKFVNTGVVRGLGKRAIGATTTALGALFGYGVAYGLNKVISTQLARGLGHLGAPHAGVVAAHYAEAAMHMTGEVIGFSTVSAVHDRLAHPQGESTFMQHFWANVAMVGAMRTIGLSTGVGRSVFSPVGKPGKRTSAQRWLYNRIAGIANAPRDVTYADRVAVGTNLFAYAREKGTPLDEVIREYKQNGLASRLGVAIDRLGQDTAAGIHMTPAEVEVARIYAEKGIEFQTSFSEALMRDAKLRREVITNGDGHSSLLEGAPGTHTQAAKVIEGGDVVPVTVPGAESAALPPVPHPTPVDSESVLAKNLGWEVPQAQKKESEIVQAQTDNYRRANELALEQAEKLQATLDAVDAGDVVVLDRTTGRTVKALQGLADKWRKNAERARNRLVAGLVGTGKVAKGSLARLQDAANTTAESLMGLETAKDVRSRFDGAEQWLSNRTPEEAAMEVPKDIRETMGNLSGEDMKNLYFLHRVAPAKLREAVDAIKKLKSPESKRAAEIRQSILTMRSRHLSGQVEAKEYLGYRTHAIQANDITQVLATMVEKVSELPRTAKGALVGGWNALGQIREVFQGLGSYIYHSGATSFVEWQAAMIARTGLQASAKFYEPVYLMVKNDAERQLQKIGELPDYAKVLDLTNDGINVNGHLWYEKGGKLTHSIFSHDGKPVMATWKNSRGETISVPAGSLYLMLLSATSSKTSVIANVSKTVRTLTDILGGKRPDGELFGTHEAPTFEVHKAADKRGWVVVDPRNGRIVRNATVIRGKKLKERRTYFSTQKEADFTARKLTQRTKGDYDQGLPQDQRDLVQFIFEHGTIDPMHAEAKGAWRKRYNFWRALEGDPNAVVMDIWGMRAMGWFHRNPDGSPVIESVGEKGEKAVKMLKPSDFRYSWYEFLVHDIAKQTGATPREVQAAMWVATKADWTKRGWQEPSDAGSRADDAGVELVMRALTNNKFRKIADLTKEDLLAKQPELMEKLLQAPEAALALEMSVSFRKNPGVERAILKRMRDCLG